MTRGAYTSFCFEQLSMLTNPKCREGMRKSHLVMAHLPLRRGVVGHNTACCGTGQEIVLAVVLGAMTASSSSTALGTSATSPPTSQTSIPTPGPSSNLASPKTLSASEKARIRVGFAALAVPIVVAIFFFFQEEEQFAG
jgi:hypothetical protein